MVLCLKDHPCFTLSYKTLFTYMKMNSDRLSFVKTSQPCFDVTYLYLYMKKKKKQQHFNNLLKSTIFVKMNSMSWFFHFSSVWKCLKYFTLQMNQSCRRLWFRFSPGRVKVDSEIFTLVSGNDPPLALSDKAVPVRLWLIWGSLGLQSKFYTQYLKKRPWITKVND